MTEYKSNFQWVEESKHWEWSGWTIEPNLTYGLYYDLFDPEGQLYATDAIPEYLALLAVRHTEGAPMK